MGTHTASRAMKSAFLSLAALACTTALPNGPTDLSTQDFIRMRCSTDGADTIVTWQGTMYSNIPQEQQKTLFSLTGMNIASCFQNKAGEWFLSSRELMYYTPPNDFSKPLHQWHNPWTGEDVTVMHVANSPVQTPLGMPSDNSGAELLASGTILGKPADVNMYYPNPLASNETFQPYSPQKMYEGGEFFKFFASAADVRTKKSPSVNTWFSWERTSQWLPWMKMGDRPGTLFASTTGSRVSSLSDLPDFHFMPRPHTAFRISPTLRRGHISATIFPNTWPATSFRYLLPMSAFLASGNL